MLSGGGVRLAGKFSGKRLTISEGVLTAGAGVALNVRGDVDNVLSDKRDGSLVFGLAKTPLNSLVDPVVNILPRQLQEATFAGSVSAGGRVELGEGGNILDGSLQLDGVRLELPSQSFSVTDINGVLPFSMGLSGKPGKRPADLVGYSRENYPRLLESFRRPYNSGQTVTVASVRFGPLELGTTSIHLSAGNGITEIASLNSSIFEGSLFGRGYLDVQQGVRYRGDILVNDLSLRRLCAMIPKIQGYISGRVDGVVSVYGAGTGMKGLLGYASLWTHEGPGERMLVSREFLQRLAGKKLRGFFFRTDRPYDLGEIRAILNGGYLTFERLDVVHTNLLGIRDLSVSVAPAGNRISLDLLLNSIKQAAARGKAASGEPVSGGGQIETEFKWQE
jgi:hypothetical protein